MNYGLNLDEVNKRDSSFFGRTGDIFNQQGLRENQMSPAGGNQFNVMSREATRSFYDSIIRPNNWRSILGTQPQSQSNYRLGTGEYTAPGSVRARTGLSGAELRAPNSIDDSYEIDVFGPGASFGGTENVFEFNDKITSRAGTLGAQASDRSGTAQAQSNYNYNEGLEFEDSGGKELGSFGVGNYGTTGSFDSTLSNPSNINFNNQVTRRTKGSGENLFRQSAEGAISSDFTGSEAIKSTGELEGNLARLGIAVGTKLASYGATTALTAANMAMMTNPATALIGLASLPISYYGSKAAARLAGDYEINKRWDTSAKAEAGLESLANIGMEDQGVFNYNNESFSNASTLNQGNRGFAQSEVLAGLNQRASGRGIDGSAINTDLYGDVGGVTDTHLTEMERIRKSKGDWNPKKQFHSDADAATSQQINLGQGIQATNTQEMSRQAVPDEWVAQNISPDLINNFERLKARFPGLYRNYNDADDYITREFFRQNPQVEAAINQQANVQNLAQAQSQGTDFQQEIQNQAESDSVIKLSGQGGVDLGQSFNLNTQQQTGRQRAPFSGTHASRATPSSTIDLKLESELSNTLKGKGAQAEAVNDLKFQFNNTDYGATLKLQSQRFINGLEQQLPLTRENQVFINSLRDNPELTALFEQDLAPETVIDAVLEYDNINKTFKNELSYVTNDNYQQAQLYDPTPEAPNSGDEIGLANIFGDVRQLDRGRLYDLGYTDTYDYDVDYKLPTPLTNQSNEYLEDQRVISGQIDNSLYYFTPGESERYNALASEFINRRYDLTDEFDTSMTDSLLNQIEGMQEGQGWDDYSSEEYQTLANLLRQERQYDLEGMNPTTSGVLSSQNYFLPETEEINPIWDYYVNQKTKKGHYVDPRWTDQGTADTLEKYYDFSQTPYGMEDYDLSMIRSGRAPGSVGYGAVKVDPETGKALTEARELTPTEFAEAQVKKDPNYTWDADLYFDKKTPVYKSSFVRGEYYGEEQYINSLSNTDLNPVELDILNDYLNNTSSDNAEYIKNKSFDIGETVIPGYLNGGYFNSYWVPERTVTHTAGVDDLYTGFLNEGDDINLTSEGKVRRSFNQEPDKYSKINYTAPSRWSPALWRYFRGRPWHEHLQYGVEANPDARNWNVYRQALTDASNQYLSTTDLNNTPLT